MGQLHLGFKALSMLFTEGIFIGQVLRIVQNLLTFLNKCSVPFFRNKYKKLIIYEKDHWNIVTIWNLFNILIMN